MLYLEDTKLAKRSSVFRAKRKVHIHVGNQIQILECAMAEANDQRPSKQS